MTFIAMLFCYPAQNFIEIGQWVAELWPKTIFKMAAVRHLEFEKNHTWSGDCHQVLNLLVYTKFHRNRMIFVEIWRFDDFQDGRSLPS